MRCKESLVWFHHRPFLSLHKNRPLGSSTPTCSSWISSCKKIIITYRSIASMEERSFSFQQHSAVRTTVWIFFYFVTRTLLASARRLFCLPLPTLLYDPRSPADGWYQHSKLYICTGHAIRNGRLIQPHQHQIYPVPLLLFLSNRIVMKWRRSWWHFAPREACCNAPWLLVSWLSLTSFPAGEKERRS